MEASSDRDLEAPQPANRSSNDGPLFNARGTGVQTLVLYLIAFSALTTLVSWRYHFAVSHYGRFILEQVLPASGIKERTRDPRKQQSIYDDPTLADLGSPYYPQNAQRYLPETDWVNPVGSDYLGVWHYTREIVHGDDPYKNPGMLIYNRSSVDARTINNPSAPGSISVA